MYFSVLTDYYDSDQIVKRYVNIYIYDKYDAAVEFAWKIAREFSNKAGVKTPEKSTDGTYRQNNIVEHRGYSVKINTNAFGSDAALKMFFNGTYVCVSHGRDDTHMDLID